jgi:microcystin-dependent protein
MNISDNAALYNVIGTTYGGNGTTTFNMPNLQGQVPMHWGTGPGGTTVIGQPLGVTSVTLTQAQTPSHLHTITADLVPSGGVVERTQIPKSVSFLADSFPDGVYDESSPTINQPFAPNVLTQVGGSQPHDNMQPYLAVNFCICLYGVYPSQT